MFALTRWRLLLILLRLLLVFLLLLFHLLIIFLLILHLLFTINIIFLLLLFLLNRLEIWRCSRFSASILISVSPRECEIRPTPDVRRSTPLSRLRRPISDAASPHLLSSFACPDYTLTHLLSSFGCPNHLTPPSLLHFPTASPALPSPITLPNPHPLCLSWPLFLTFLR